MLNTSAVDIKIDDGSNAAVPDTGGGSADAHRGNRFGSGNGNFGLLVPANGHGLNQSDDSFPTEKLEDTDAEGNRARDPWSMPDSTHDDTGPSWHELERKGKIRVIVYNVIRISVLVGLLYLFICSLDLLASAFRLIGARQAGVALSDSRLLQNPVAGLMIGVLATVLVQSSSTSTSIVVTMVASGILDVRLAIPIIMGANIGTSVTNTIVSLAQSADRDQFRRAFAGATVHDMFNWMSVLVLLPLEATTGYMYHVTSALVSGFSWQHDAGSDRSSTGTNRELLQTLTKPLTTLIIQLDKNVIEGIAMSDPNYADASLIKEWCEYKIGLVKINVTSALAANNVSIASLNATTSVDYVDIINSTAERDFNATVPVKPCWFLFQGQGLTDATVGVILLVLSLFVICTSLIAMVKLLNSMLRGAAMSAAHQAVNAELPGRAAPLTGYVAMLAGAVVTVVLQSSSVFTSMLTPLVGIGVVSIERVYPLTLGSNLGTTTTGLFAALAATADRLQVAIQIALCHLLFNLSGILLFYPVPALRLPIQLARAMGNTTAKYRWFAVVYLLAAFFLLPATVFALSMAGPVALTTVIAIVATVALAIATINLLQQRRPYWLPPTLRSWDRVPLCLRSLEPADRVMSAGAVLLRRACSCCLNRCCHDDEENEKYSDGVLKAGSGREPYIDSQKHVGERRKRGGEEHVTSGQKSRFGRKLPAKPVISVSSLGPSKLRWGSMSSTNRLLQWTDGSESGYSSVSTTPAPSRFPSYAVMELDDITEQPQQRSEEDEARGAAFATDTARPSSPPTRVVMRIAEEDSDKDDDDDDDGEGNAVH